MELFQQLFSSHEPTHRFTKGRMTPKPARPSVLEQQSDTDFFPDEHTRKRNTSLYMSWLSCQALGNEPFTLLPCVVVANRLTSSQHLYPAHWGCSAGPWDCRCLRHSTGSLHHLAPVHQLHIKTRHAAKGLALLPHTAHHSSSVLVLSETYIFFLVWNKK